MSTADDIKVVVSSEQSRHPEYRVSPSWTLDHLRARLEPITGIPTAAQRLILGPGAQVQPLDGLDGAMSLARLGLYDGIELRVDDLRPAGARDNYTDVSGVEKYEMPQDEYETRTDSVLAWKKAQKLGRFNPNAATLEEQKIRAVQREIDERHIVMNARCRILPESDSRRGTVSYIGPVPQIPSLGPWIGVALDEPTGKNDGSIEGGRYFSCPQKHGVFLRPERVEVGDYPPLNEFDDEEF